MEQLCLDQQEDVIASNQAMEAAEEKLAEAEGAAQASSEDAKAAQAMATELRDRVALLEADADIKASQQGIIEGLEVALAEARQAAASALADRETFQSKWRAEWEAAKDEHAAELRGGRARMAMLEADLAELRETPHRAEGMVRPEERAGDPAVRGAGAGAQIRGGPEGSG